MKQNDAFPKNRDNDNPYKGLRSMALNVTAEQLQLSLPKDKTKVYGVIMDLDLGKGVGTFVSFQTGYLFFKQEIESQMNCQRPKQNRNNIRVKGNAAWQQCIYKIVAGR